MQVRDMYYEFKRVMASNPGTRLTRQAHSKSRVSYFHPKDVGNYHYGVS
jgi:hypothetical protein